MKIAARFMMILATAWSVLPIILSMYLHLHLSTRHRAFILFFLIAPSKTTPTQLACAVNGTRGWLLRKVIQTHVLLWTLAFGMECVLTTLTRLGIIIP
jgi:hypothetical protein